MSKQLVTRDSVSTVIPVCDACYPDSGSRDDVQDTKYGWLCRQCRAEASELGTANGYDLEDTA